MHTDIPLIAVAFVGMSVTTCRVVLFQHANFPPKFAEQRRARQPAHARANDDRVVLGRETFGSVAIADAEGAGFHGFEFVVLFVLALNSGASAQLTQPPKNCDARYKAFLIAVGTPYIALRLNI